MSCHQASEQSLTAKRKKYYINPFFVTQSISVVVLRIMHYALAKIVMSYMH
jgi:hypothetical protein